MNKLISLFFVVFSSVCLAVSSYNNDTYEIHFNVPDNWSVIERQNGKVIDIVHNSHTATINISYYQYEAPVTANGVQIMRATGRYDGWMNMFERPGSVKENSQANVDESYVAVYSKHGLSDDGMLRLQELIVGEYYYVLGKNAAIISLQTEHSFWKVIQGNLRTVVDSFWMGKERKKERVLNRKQRRKKEAWTHSGENGKNQYYFSAPVSWNATLSPVFQTEIASQNGSSYTLPIVADRMVVGSVGHHLYGVELATGKKVWGYDIEGTIRRNMSYGQDIVSLVIEDETSSLISIIPETGLVLFKKEIDTVISDPVMVSENIVVVTDHAVMLINGVTGEDVWKVKGRFLENSSPVWTNDTLFVVKDDSTIEARSLKTGKKQWDYRADHAITLNPMISSDNIVFGSMSSDRFDDNQESFLTGISVSEGTLVWQKSLHESTIIDSSLIAGTDEDVVVVTHYDNHYIVSLFESQTGELRWREPFTLWSIKRPLVASSFIMFPSEHHSILNFDVLTGESLEFSYPYSDKLHCFLMTSCGLLGLEEGDKFRLSLYR